MSVFTRPWSVCLSSLCTVVCVYVCQIAGCVLLDALTAMLSLQQIIVGVRGAVWATHLCTYQRLLNQDDACHVV